MLSKLQLFGDIRIFTSFWSMNEKLSNKDQTIACALYMKLVSEVGLGKTIRYKFKFTSVHIE